MNIYIAGSYTRRSEFQSYAEKLEELGHNVTSRWLQGPEDDRSYDIAAREDLMDVLTSELVLHFVEELDSGYHTGGRHVEFGIALGASHILEGMGLHIHNVLIGPNKENIFHHLACDEFKTFDEFVSYYYAQSSSAE